MRPALAVALAALLAVPASQGFHNVDGLTLLLDEADPIPRWHSVILEWEGTKEISGHRVLHRPHAAPAHGGEFPRWGSAVFLERQREDGSWGWLAGFSGNAAGLGNSRARVTLQGPVEVTHEVLPVYHQEPTWSGTGWGFISGPGRYRVTAWAAGDVPDGIFEFNIWGEEGVRLLAHREGNEVTWIEADDHAAVAASANVVNYGAWARAAASISSTFEHNAFITDPTGLNEYQTCVCLRTGPYPGWDGSIFSTLASGVVNGPPGTYEIDVLGSQNNRAHLYPYMRTPAPASYNDGLAWVMADVEHAVAPDEVTANAALT